MEIDVNVVRNYAIKKHGDQKYGDKPYVYHLDKVYQVTVDHNLSPIIQIGAYLHDVLEDTDTTCADLKREFGLEDLVSMVYCVTDEPGKNRKERKRVTFPKIRSNPNAIALKLCDRIANVRACIESKNKNLFNMYKKEQPEFERQLKKPKILEGLWEELDCLLGEDL